MGRGIKKKGNQTWNLETKHEFIETISIQFKNVLRMLSFSMMTIYYFGSILGSPCSFSFSLNKCDSI